MSPALRASDVERNDRVRPPRVMVPASAVNAPVKIFTSVLLPAPLAPISAWISPPRTRRSAARRATTGPKCLTSPLASSKAAESASGVSLGTADILKVGRGQQALAPSRCRLAGTLAGDQVLLAVGRVRLDVERDAVVRVQGRIVGRRQLGDAVGGRVVPNLRREVNHVGVGLGLLQRGKTHREARATDRRRGGHGGPRQALFPRTGQGLPQRGVLRPPRGQRGVVWRVETVR